MSGPVREPSACDMRRADGRHDPTYMVIYGAPPGVTQRRCQATVAWRLCALWSMKPRLAGSYTDQPTSLLICPFKSAVFSYAGLQRAGMSPDDGGFGHTGLLHVKRNALVLQTLVIDPISARSGHQSTINRGEIDVKYAARR